MIKAVIFDFDGLVLDTETVWYEAYREVLKKQFQFDLSIEEFSKCVGSSDTGLFSYLKQEIGDHVEIDDLRRSTSEIHRKNIKEIQAREGVEDYLRDAKKAGLKVSLATSSTRNWAVTHLTNLGLLSYFDHLITQDDVEHIKPAPDLFLKALKVLEVEPDEAVVLEDSLNGLLAAQAANIRTVIIPNPVTESLAFEGYHLKLRSLADMNLSDLIDSLHE